MSEPELRVCEVDGRNIVYAAQKFRDAEPSERQRNELDSISEFVMPKRVALLAGRRIRAGLVPSLHMITVLQEPRKAQHCKSWECEAACPPSIMRRFQANNCEGAMPARRATKDTLMPGCMASSTSRTFSAADHRRRRCTEVMTSNREIGPSEGVVIVVIIGLRLCLISYAECPVEKGGSSVPVSTNSTEVFRSPRMVASSSESLRTRLNTFSNFSWFQLCSPTASPSLDSNTLSQRLSRLFVRSMLGEHRLQGS